MSIHCDTCGAEIRRAPDERLEHEWHIETAPGRWQKGVMIGYQCPRWHVKHPYNAWGKLRVVMFRVAADSLTDWQRENAYRTYERPEAVTAC